MSSAPFRCGGCTQAVAARPSPGLAGALSRATLVVFGLPLALLIVLSLLAADIAPAIQAALLGLGLALVIGILRCTRQPLERLFEPHREELARSDPASELLAPQPVRVMGAVEAAQDRTIRVSEQD